MRKSEFPDAPPRGLLSRASLFLDFDGTLVDIAPSPDAVQVSARLSALIARMARGDAGGPARVAILTGRPADQLHALLGAPAFPLGGSHGAELRWPDGCVENAIVPSSLPQLVSELHVFAVDHPGVLVEVKPFGAALHYRQAPQAEAASKAVAAQLAARHGFAVQHGKMVAELKIPGVDKGQALRRLYRQGEGDGEAPLTPVMIGDDLTDETAFRAAMDLGGAGILVGPPRDTCASYRLPDVEATLSWLEGECAA